MKKDNFEIKVNGLTYGKYRKELSNTDYRTAVKTYTETQDKFKNINCEVVLNKVDVSDNGKENSKLLYKNKTSNEYLVETKLKKIMKIFKEIEEIKDFHRQMSNSGTEDFNNVRHVIEMGETESLSPEDCKRIFHNIQEKAIVRRFSKTEYETYKDFREEIDHLQNRTANLLDKYKKRRYLNSTDKAVQNSNKANEKYRDSLKALLE